MDEYHHNANQLNQPRAALPGLIENPGIPLQLDRKGCPEDYFFCVRDVARNALVLGMDNPRDPTPQESREIALILDSLPILERAGRKSFPSYGQQRAWKRRELDGMTD